MLHESMAPEFYVCAWEEKYKKMKTTHIKIIYIYAYYLKRFAVTIFQR